MSETASIVTFMRTGRLGPLEIGSPEASVRALLGPPDAIGRGSGKMLIQQYAGGRLELTLSKAKLVVLIALFPFRGSKLSGVALVDDLPAGASESSAVLEQWLVQESLSFDIVDESSDSRVLRLATGVTVSFESGSLYTLQCS
jgi:hypothetical protein